MSNSTRYFQLTPEILVEYGYSNLSEAHNQLGDASGHISDMENGSYVVYNGYCSTRTFYMDGTGERFVLPINKSESRFVQVVNGNGRNINFTFSDPISYSSGNDDMTDDILIDRFRLHFTSRNYLGDYDGFIITVNVYDGLKNKVCLMSRYVKRTDDLDINRNPVLINQKLYTSYKDFEIPNAYAISEADEIKNDLPGASVLRENLFPGRSISKNYDILRNSPVMMSIYGVKATYASNGYENYVTERINTIYIPLVDKSNEMSIHIGEASDGDYFEIYPQIDNSSISFSDYIYNLSDGHPEYFIVFHELTLIEHYVDSLNQQQDDITHREQYIINAAQQIMDNGDTILEINEKELDGIMYYRPVLKHSGRVVWFTIEVKTNIINTFDNTTTVRKVSIDYGNPGEDPQTMRNQNSIIVGNPKKYGKRMSRIYLGDVPAQVNVYNKKPEIDTDSIKITNASSSVKIENHQHSVIGFIECANVGVTIEQIPKEKLQ